MYFFNLKNVEIGVVCYFDRIYHSFVLLKWTFIENKMFLGWKFVDFVRPFVWLDELLEPLGWVFDSDDSALLFCCFSFHFLNVNRCPLLQICINYEKITFALTLSLPAIAISKNHKKNSHFLINFHQQNVDFAPNQINYSSDSSCLSSLKFFFSAYNRSPINLPSQFEKGLFKLTFD